MPLLLSFRIAAPAASPESMITGQRLSQFVTTGLVPVVHSESSMPHGLPDHFASRRCLRTFCPAMTMRIIRVLRVEQKSPRRNVLIQQQKFKCL
jgi:hypothetical protein